MKTAIPTEPDVCRFLDWDSNFFNRRIGRVLTTAPDAATLRTVMRWAVDHEIDCLYCLCESDQPESTRALENHRFTLTDIRVTLDYRGATLEALPPRPDLTIRAAQSSDEESLKALARTSFTDSRFYADPHFAREQCDRLYEVWLTNSLNRDPDSVLVAARAGQVAGFISCEMNDGVGHIGLIAVDSAHQGAGVGTALTRASLGWFSDHHADHVVVVTQGRNIGAQRTYQKLGFKTRAIQLWYHWWRD